MEEPGIGLVGDTVMQRVETAEELGGLQVWENEREGAKLKTIETKNKK